MSKNVAGYQQVGEDKMQQFDSREEREIDLIDLMWRLLMQWKPIICVMVLCAVLVVAFKYVRDVRGYQAAIKEEKQEDTLVETDEEDLLEELTQTEYEDVISAYNSKTQVESLRKYLSESLILQANPYDMRTLMLYYRVDSADETAYSITSMYGSLLGSDPFMEEIAKAIDYDGELKYVRELVSFGAPGIESKSLVFSVKMSLLTDMDADKIAKTIDAYVLQTAYKDISASRPFTVLKTYESVQDVVNTDTTTARMDFDARIRGMETAIDASVAEFSEPQKMLYKKLTKTEEEEEEKETVFKEPEEGVSEKPGISLKYLVIGLFVGAFLYGGCVLMYAVFRPTLQTTTEMKDVYRLYQIDELHQRSFAGGMQGFVNDKNVYKLRYRKSNADAETSVKEAATQIVGLRERGEIGTVYLAPLGKSFSGGQAAEYYSKLKQRLADSGVEIAELSESNLKDEILSVPQTAGIVVLTNIGDTTYHSLDDVCGYARKYDIAILGVVALDV